VLATSVEFGGNGGGYSATVDGRQLSVVVARADA
jgi:hypothetical protein